MASGQNSATITEKGHAIELEINGKPVMIISAAFSSSNNELLRRFPTIGLDETKLQTRQVLKFQAQCAIKGGVQYDQMLRLALSYIEPVEVFVPFADGLAEKFPDALMARTAFSRLIDFIKASASAHQYARKKDFDGRILAEEQDYSIGSECFLQTTPNESLIPLTAPQKKVLAFFEEHQGERFSIESLQEKENKTSLPFPDRSLRRYLENLADFGFLTVENEKVEKSIKPILVYSFKNCAPLSLPLWEEITSNNVANQANRQIDKCMAEQANKANQEKSEDLIQSAKFAQFAKQNPLYTTEPEKVFLAPKSCYACGGKACVAMKDGRNLCAGCYSKEKVVLPDA
jgi:hypothetical protein